jgi:choline dehydrogenase
MTIRIAAVLQRPRSVGRVTLASADAHMQPRIAFNLCDDQEDVRRLAEGVRLIFAVAQHPAMAAHLEGAAMLDDGMVLSIEEAAAMLSDAEAALAFVRRAVNHYYHAVGTARIGPVDDPGAVVDQSCRLRGVDGLRVVDASMMPTIPRANTNLTCIMIAERVADWMREA